MCTHSIDPMGIHMLHCAHGNEHIRNSWCSLWHLCWHRVRFWFPRGTKVITCTSFNHIQFLSSTNRHCIHQKWHLHFSRCCHCQPNVSKFISSILHNSRIHCLQCGSSQRNELFQSTPHRSILPISNWNIWTFTQTSRCVFRQLCQCHLELEMVRKPSSFCLGYFFSTKFFNHITKNVNIFHFKSGNNCRPSYFLISTPLGHTFHHHDRHIASGWFLTWKNMANLLEAINFWHGEILTFSLD